MIRPTFAATVSTVALAALTLAGCGSGEPAPDTSGTASTVAVAAGDDTCGVATTVLPAGTITFDVTNEGKQTTEVYVYGPDDRVMGEVENIGPGLARDLVVTLDGGDYEVACKPGQTGDGIRTAITVEGDLGIDLPEAGRQIVVEGTDFAFAGLPTTPFTAGETIDFELKNLGKADHEMEVFGPDGDELGEVGRTAPGAEGHLLLTLTAPGTYRVVCGIDDHESRGMVTTFEVA